jgi:hypothetical protein
MHFNKRDGSDPYRRLSASGAFYNAVRSVLVWGDAPDRDDDSPDQHRILAVEKMNLAKKPGALRFRLDEATAEQNGVTVETVRVTPLGDAVFDAAELLGRPERGSKVRQAESLIETLWGDLGWVAATDVEEAGEKAGIGKTTMQRALDNLGGEAVKAGFTSGWYWCVPGSRPPRNGAELPTTGE